MADERMALLELIEKGADADLVRDLPAFASERLMAAEVEQLTGAAAGARSPGRINHRNGYRERSEAPLPTGDPRWPDRAGHPEATQGLLLPGLPGAAPDCREGPDGGHPGGLELFRGERKSSASSRPRAGRPQEA